MGKLRKQLSAPGLLGTARKSFDSITDLRRKGSPISLADALMSGLAVFSLKYASLLQYDRQRRDPAEAHNLRTLYGVKRAPSDTQMREILDEVDPSSIRPVFKKIFSSLQRGKVLESYQYLGDYYFCRSMARASFPRIRSTVANAARRRIERESGPIIINS